MPFTKLTTPQIKIDKTTNNSNLPTTMMNNRPMIHPVQEEEVHVEALVLIMKGGTRQSAPLVEAVQAT